MVCPLIVPRTHQTSTLASVDSDGFRVGRCRASCRSQSIAATRDSRLCAQRSHTEDIETSAKKKKAVQTAMKARKKRRPYHTARATSWLTCKLSGNKPIRLGTECSGLESVMVALNMMTSRTELAFICEKEPVARRLILAQRNMSTRT